MVIRMLILVLCCGCLVTDNQLEKWGEDIDPCSAYVDYMCDCYEPPEDSTSTYDCDEQRTLYEDATLEQHKECALELDIQQQYHGSECAARE